MLNNKGFTIAEVLVSFGLITVILLSIVGSTVFYRDKLKDEEIKSELVDFKSNITKIVYDDILSGRINHVETCLEVSNCLSLTGEDGSIHTLRIVEVATSTENQKRGAYLSYDGDKYFLPDSDISEVDDSGNIIRECDFINGLRYSYYNDIYTIKITYEHQAYDQKYEIMFTIIGGKNVHTDEVPRPTLMMVNSVVNLVYNGASVDNPYRYNGDGYVSCRSGDTTKVTCSVSRTNKTVRVNPVEPTDTPVVIYVDGNQISSHYESPSTSFLVNVQRLSGAVTLANDNMTLTLGDGNGETTYTYNGDGEVNCTSSDSTKATCSVNKSTHKVIVTPIAAGDATISLTSTQTLIYSASQPATIDVTVKKRTSSLSVDNSALTVTLLGGNGEKVYTYTGNGTVNCSSSNTAKARCSVDSVHHKIIVTPVASGSATITVSASETATYYSPTVATFAVNVNKATPTITIDSSEIELTYGAGDGEKEYTYTGNGTVSCSSSNNSRATCRVDSTNHKILVTPEGSGEATITVSASETSTYNAPIPKTFVANVTRITCAAPTNLAVSTSGIVTWTASSNCSSAQHQISIDGTNYVDATSGVDFNSTITLLTGSRTIYVRAIAPDVQYVTSDDATRTVTVYSMTLSKGDDFSAVSGAGNYISGYSVEIDATLENHYIWKNWTGTETITTQNTSITIDKNYSLTANSTYLCNNPRGSESCSWGTCSCSSGRKSGTCITYYYSTVSGYTSHLCSNTDSYGSSTSCSCSCYYNKYYYDGGCAASDCNGACVGWAGYDMGYCGWQYCHCCNY